ncbi:Gfo/Idh/MocA family protein [Aquibacillus sediminis]|uniref:Gfo/Idh/MocA family protein n=1 Tax=Aquibacillus sediminis TaxID=2574734 RepID=UPI0011093B03|nr:Gfo/Idh/MocA family oxidoreductase [Aquibacillus sediminis]
MKKIQWGVLSTAKIGRTQVIPAIQRSKNGEVAAIASRGGEKAREVAKSLNIPTAYDSYEALLEDQTIDAVYIPLPNSLHKEWVIEAAKQGKHILCEKPAALNSSELKEMLLACEMYKVTFMEAFMYQFHPQHQLVKEWIQAGEIGDVAFARASFSFVLNDGSNIRMNSDLGGGSLYDIGCYTIHSLRHVLDEEPTNVYASAKLHPELNVDTTVAGVLNFASGIRASFDCSFASIPRNEYEIIGSKGKIEVKGAYRPDQNEDGNGSVRLIKDNNEVIERSIEGDQYKLQVEHFADCLLENKQPSYTIENMIHHTTVMDSCYESIDTGKPVAVHYSE